MSCRIELLAQGHQRSQELGLSESIRVPTCRQHSVRGNHALGMAGQEYEDIEFLGSQRQVLTAQGYGSRSQVDFEIPGLGYFRQGNAALGRFPVRHAIAFLCKRFSQITVPGHFSSHFVPNALSLEISSPIPLHPVSRNSAENLPVPSP